MQIVKYSTKLPLQYQKIKQMKNLYLIIDSITYNLYCTTHLNRQIIRTSVLMDGR